MYLKKTSRWMLLLTLALPTVGYSAGTVRILTTPGDALLYVNGQRKGNSPETEGQTFAVKLAEGEVLIEAKKADSGIYELYGQKKVFVGDETLQTVTITLQQRVSEAARQKIKDDLKASGKTVLEPTMVKVPAGSFDMGSNEGSSREKPVHRVRIAAFEMAATEVTFEQWEVCVVLGGCSHQPDDEGWGRGSRPVINVSWEDAQQYAAWLSAATGKNYRLPTEAEWEYACRSGGKAQTYCGGSDLDALAWYDKNSGGKTHPVGEKRPNGLGIYDMSGNVWEWCADVYHDNYDGAPTDGSAWAGDGAIRVRRGGSWYNSPQYTLAASRNWLTPDYRSNDLGFRLVLGAPGQK